MANYARIIEDILGSDDPIILDLDDTTLDFLTPLTLHLNRTYGTGLEPNHICIYEFSNIRPLKEKGVTFKKLLEDLRAFGNTEEFISIQALDGFLEVYRIITRGHEDLKRIYFVTSRSTRYYDDPREKTVSTLKRIGIPYIDENLILTDKKHEFAKKIGAKFVFDDSLNIARQFLSNSFSGNIIMRNTAANTVTDMDLLLLDEYSRYEKSHKVKMAEDPRVIRFDNWYQFLEP